MGQQQLLFLVLGIVIVGIAVLIGINAFSENNVKSNADALVNEGVRIANAIQAWTLTPTQMGGGGSTGLAQLEAGTRSLSNVGFALGTNGCGTTEYGNYYGCFALESSKDAACADPVPEEDGGASLYINARNDETGNRVCVLVSGTKDSNIAATVFYGT